MKTQSYYLKEKSQYLTNTVTFTKVSDDFIVTIHLYNGGELNMNVEQNDGDYFQPMRAEYIREEEWQEVVNKLNNVLA